MEAMKEFDTIAAIATNLGESGVSIIRVSGDKALSIVSSIFTGKNDRKLDDIRTYSMRYGFIIDKDTKEKLDEVDRKSTRLNSSHANISYAVFCLKKKKINNQK